jgi:hypothetical protein
MARPNRQHAGRVRYPQRATRGLTIPFRDQIGLGIFLSDLLKIDSF